MRTETNEGGSEHQTKHNGEPDGWTVVAMYEVLLPDVPMMPSLHLGQSPRIFITTSLCGRPKRSFLRLGLLTASSHPPSSCLQRSVYLVDSYHRRSVDVVYTYRKRHIHGCFWPSP